MLRLAFSLRVERRGRGGRARQRHEGKELCVTEGLDTFAHESRQHLGAKVGVSGRIAQHDLPPDIAVGLTELVLVILIVAPAGFEARLRNLEMARHHADDPWIVQDVGDGSANSRTPGLFQDELEATFLQRADDRARGAQCRRSH